MKKKAIPVLIAALATLVAAAALRADPYDVGLDFLDSRNGADVQLTSPTPPSAAGLVTRTLYAGAWHHAVNPLSPGADLIASPGFPADVELFCIDIGQRVEGIADSGGSMSPYYVDYRLANLATAPRPYAPPDTNLQPLSTWGNYPMGQERANWVTLLAQEYWSDDYLKDGALNPIPLSYAALQTAIWEIIFEGIDAATLPGAWDAGDGDFKLEVGDPGDTETLVAAEANSILAALTTQATNAGGVAAAIDPNTYVSALVSDTYQDLLVFTNEFVPEPGGIGLAALGLLALLGQRKKRQN